MREGVEERRESHFTKIVCIRRQPSPSFPLLPACAPLLRLDLVYFGLALTTSPCYLLCYKCLLCVSCACMPSVCPVCVCVCVCVPLARAGSLVAFDYLEQDVFAGRRFAAGYETLRLVRAGGRAGLGAGGWGLGAGGWGMGAGGWGRGGGGGVVGAGGGGRGGGPGAGGGGGGGGGRGGGGAGGLGAGDRVSASCV